MHFVDVTTYTLVLFPNTSGSIPRVDGGRNVRAIGLSLLAPGACVFHALNDVVCECGVVAKLVHH